MNTVDDAQKQLDELKARHREIDEMILQVNKDLTKDQLEIQRLKRQKLQLKDEISRIEADLLPDIIAWNNDGMILPAEWSNL